MTSRFVREIGGMQDARSIPVIIGVDHDTVRISLMPGFNNLQFGAQQAEEFARLFMAACWEAARCHQCDCPPEYAHPEGGSDG